MALSCRSPFAARVRASPGLINSTRSNSTLRWTTPNSTSLPRRKRRPCVLAGKRLAMSLPARTQGRRWFHLIFKDHQSALNSKREDRVELNDIRRRFAEEIRAVANIRSEALIAAFAKVPRENFLGPGP